MIIDERNRWIIEEVRDTLELAAEETQHVLAGGDAFLMVHLARLANALLVCAYTGARVVARGIVEERDAFARGES